MATTIDKIDIIIPNKSNIDDLFKCLDSLLKNIDVKKYKLETIIVDDYSNRSERSSMIKKFKNDYSLLNIYPIFLGKHYGYTKAINTGLTYSLNKKSKPKYIAFLHNDTIILKDWLENLIYQVENDILTLGVGSVTLNELESQCITKILPKINPKKDINEYLMATEKNIEEVSLKIWSNNDKLEFIENNFDDKISLFSALFKIEAFEKFGLFDDDLISSIKVENDFCKRLIENGKKVTIVPKSFVHHKCRNLSYISNLNVSDYKKLSLATIENMELKHNFNFDVPIKKNYVIYTYVEEYGELPKIKEFDNDVEYICFTMDDRIYGNRNKHHPWKIFKINNLIDALNIEKFNRKIKQFIMLHPHFFFKNFNISIFIDSNKIYDIEPKTEEYVRLFNPKHFLLGLNSCKIDCAYSELIKQFKNEIITKETYNNILQLFNWFRYPKNNGLINTSIIIRKHNDERSKHVMNKIWNYVNKYNASELVFFNLVLWYFKYGYSYIPENLFYKKYVKLIEGR